MASPISTAYSDVDRRLSPYLRHTPPRLAFPGIDLQPHPEYIRSWPLWAMIRDCYEGEHTIKAAGETYLRRLGAHKKHDEYESFLSRAYFYNAVRRTAVGLMGSLFRKPAEFSVPPYLGLNLRNVTLDGQDVESFTKGVAHEVVITGRYGILVDLPAAPADKAEASRYIPQPYLAGYTAENVYFWREILHRGRRIVDRVILREQETTLTEYGQTVSDVVRVLRLDPVGPGGDMVYSQQLIRPNGDASQPPSVSHVPVSIMGRPLDYIPFVFVNSADNLPAVSAPPMLDIATINISHYQSTALLEHARFYAGMPTYVTAAGEGASGGGGGVPEGAQTFDALTVGPSNVWELEHGAKAWILEFNGHGLTFLENAVDAKQLQMQSLGGKLISAQRKAAALSSEAWNLLETGDEATLLDVALSVERAMTTALTYLADFNGKTVREDNPLIVELNKEFVRSDLTARELRAIQALYERGIIPLDVLYYALREVNVIPIEYSLEDFKKLLTQEDQKYEPPAPPPPVQPNPTAPRNTGPE